MGTTVRMRQISWARARHVSLRAVAGLAALTALGSCCGGECAQHSSTQPVSQSVSSPPVTIRTPAEPTLSDALRVGAITPPATAQSAAVPKTAIPPPPATPSAGSSAAAPSSRAVEQATAAGYPRAFPAFVARLLADARSGADPDLAPAVDLLEAITANGLDAGPDLQVARIPELERSSLAPIGRGTAWATIATYRERGASADALRAVYLDFDRLHEWTGKRGTRLLRREGVDTYGSIDAVRSAFGIQFGARWHIRTRSLDRGDARLLVTTMVDSPTTSHMLATHGILLLFPEADAVRVVEANTSVVDFEVPGIVKGAAVSSAKKEMENRIGGFRAHWREYVRR